MNGKHGIVKNELAVKIVHEFNVFMKETKERIDETRRVTMFSLKKLLNLKDGDVIEIQEDDTFRIISTQELKDGE